MKPRITFRGIRPDLASTRLRAEIPQRELAELGIERGRDILVIGKHGWSWDEATAGYRKVVMDVCDDHFGGVHDAHYRLACSQADAVTCNSAAMRDRIKAETGRDAWVIPDPWEAPEGKPRVHERLVWFGHKTNLRDLVPWLDRLAGRPLAIVSNVDAGPPGVRVVQWSPDAMDREFIDAGLCVIPTGKSACKSGNRAVESIRRGVFPICGYLPAYGDLGVYVGDIAEGVDWALSHHDEVMQRIRASQQYVGWQYNPKRIAKLWLEALSYV